MPANKNKKPANPPPAARPGELPKAEGAFERVKLEMARLGPASLGKINLDTSQAVSPVKGVLLSV